MFQSRVVISEIYRQDLIILTVDARIHWREKGNGADGKAGRTFGVKFMLVGRIYRTLSGPGTQLILHLALLCG